MEFKKLVKNIEAMIFASDRPLSVEEIVNLVNQRHENQEGKDDLVFEEEVTEEQVQSVIQTIIEKYSEDFYPFEVSYTGGGYTFLTKKELHEVVAPVCQDKKLKKLSSAAMETLSIIAYKQPVTKAEIEYIRGVAAEYSVQKLMEKELIVIAGRKEDAIGKPLLYKTTENFVDYLGIESFDELPKLSELFDVSTVQASEIGTDGQTAAPKEYQDMDEEKKDEDGDETDATMPAVDHLVGSTEMVDMEKRKEILNDYNTEENIEVQDE